MEKVTGIGGFSFYALVVASTFSALALFAPRSAVGQYAVDLGTVSFEELELEGGSTTDRRLGATFARAPDHRYEGAAIGALVFGLGGAYLVGGLCASSDNSDNCGIAALKAGIGLGALGALTGALIGAQFSKDTGEVRQ